MRIIPLIVLALVTTLLFSGLASIDSGLPGGMNPPALIYQPTGGTGNINFTIYSPQGTFYRSMMMNYLNESGIGTVSYGSLIQASVPVNVMNSFTESMGILEKNFNISYFQDGKSLLFQPFSSPAQIEVPFAYTPSEIALAYGYNAAYASGLNGKGETIAIVDAFGDPTIRYDVMAFDELMNLPPINLSVIYPPGSSGIQQANASWALETATDVEWAHAMAPDAHINLIISSDASNGLLNAVSYAISNRLGNIISLSWGTPESELGAGTIQVSSAVFHLAQNANITVFAASGDLGAYDGTSQLTVNFPSSDPYVTGVGGTSLYYNNIKGWYQYAWGGTANGLSYGSGGGFSKLAIPYWQSAPGINSTVHKRGVPDVSMVASVNTGVEIIQGGSAKEVGGTSVGTPMWAAIGAMIDQATGRNVGTINPMLYQIARTGLYKSALTQITSGNNGYYQATPGWNPVTGLGTPIVGNLISDAEEIMGTYGTVAIINSSGYNSTSVAANITLGSGSSQNYSSGSSYYYVSEYSSGENFVKAGVSDLNGTFSAEYRIEQNGVLVSGSDPLPNLSGKTVPLSLIMRGTNITASAGNQSFNLNYLLSFAGDYQAAFGAEITGSEYNLTNLTGAFFSNVTVAVGSNSEPVSSVYMERYSQIPSEQNYSSIELSQYGTQYNVSYAINGYNHFINGTAISDTFITYKLAYNAGITGTFALNSGVSASWEVNGKVINGNTYPFTKGGHYNITAIVNPTHIYSRNISIPSLFSTNITVKGYSTATYSPLFSGILDNFYGTGPVGLNKTKVYAIYGVNQLELSGSGFYGNTVSFNAGHNTTITMQPVNANLSIFVFQGNSTVEVNNNSVHGNNGIYKVTLDPGKANISVRSAGYLPYYLNLSLLPSENLSPQVNLTESGNNPIISGRVSDYNFGFGLQGVNVSLINTTFFSFTNASGVYYLQSPTGNHTLNYSRDLYMSINTTLVVSTNAIINVRLSPAHVEIFNFNLSIEKYFPLLFFTLYLQWSPYSGTDFSYYVVSVSSTASFTPGTVNNVIVSNQGQNSMFFTGIYPGNTYYVALSIHLNDGSIYSTNYVTVSYSNPVFLFANLVIIGGTAFIIGVLLWTVADKKDRWKF